MIYRLSSSVRCYNPWNILLINQILLSKVYTVFVINIPIIPLAFLGLLSLLETRHWIVQAAVASTTKFKARVMKDDNGRIVNINKYKYVYISYGYGLLGRSMIDTHTILRFGTITWMKYVIEDASTKTLSWRQGSIIWKSYYLIASDSVVRGR